jgi:serine protease Do
MTAAAILAPPTRGSARPTLGTELEALAERLKRATVHIHTRGDRFDGVGAGVLWSFRGQAIVLTNAHVVPARRGDAASVEDRDGRVVTGRVLARNRERDLAVLSLADLPHEWPAPARLGEAAGLRVGEIVVALGHPFGVAGALSVGVLHVAPVADDRWLQADIRLAPGNSGGPLATLDGTVIGINAMIVRGLGIAVPASTARAFVAQVLGAPNEDAA